jgi:outer membrane lipoprotein-sorting protein
MPKKSKTTLLQFALTFLIIVSPTCYAQQPDPAQLIKSVVDYWRGKTSYTELNMTIHRPEWERTLGMQGWTRGREDALIRFTSPAKDSGNATLKLGISMWIFTPKLNQVIKLPASMMAQSWMGSDFSYNDLAKSDQIINDYTHTLVDTQKQDGHAVYTIDSVPKPGAPVVWGKERLRIRDDNILLEETFFDQDMQVVKRMQTLKIAPLGGRPYPVVMRMTTVDKKDHWTELDYQKGQFDLKLPAYLFTLSNLRNPRPWSTP